MNTSANTRGRYGLDHEGRDDAGEGSGTVRIVKDFLDREFT